MVGRVFMIMLEDCHCEGVVRPKQSPTLRRGLFGHQNSTAKNAPTNNIGGDCLAIRMAPQKTLLAMTDVDSVGVARPCNGPLAMTDWDFPSSFISAAQERRRSNDST